MGGWYFTENRDFLVLEDGWSKIREPQLVRSLCHPSMESRKERVHAWGEEGERVRGTSCSHQEPPLAIGISSIHEGRDLTA